MLGRDRGGGAGASGASAVAGRGGLFTAAAAPPPPGVGPGITGLDAGVPGAGGSADMRYAGVLRMRGMPYRSASAVRVLLKSWSRCASHVPPGRKNPALLSSLVHVLALGKGSRCTRGEGCALPASQAEASGSLHHVLRCRLQSLLS